MWKGIEYYNTIFADILTLELVMNIQVYAHAYMTFSMLDLSMHG